jgi:hypothetical protein
MTLLILGLAGVVPAAAGGSHWDSSCNCRRPDSEYTTRRIVREAPRVITHKRVIDRTRVVRGDTKLIQENRIYLHVRPVINREVIVHRTNTLVRDVYLHRVNPIHRLRVEHHHQVVNRYVEGWTRPTFANGARCAAAVAASTCPTTTKPAFADQDSECRRAGKSAGRLFCSLRSGAAQIRLIGMAPRKSRLPISTPQWRTMA